MYLTTYKLIFPISNKNRTWSWQQSTFQVMIPVLIIAFYVNEIYFGNLQHRHGLYAPGQFAQLSAPYFGFCSSSKYMGGASNKYLRQG